jgi:hypothetical protein
MSNLPISRIHAFGIWISDIYFNFLMLCHWLASQEGFSVGWWQVLRTCLNSYKNATKLKSQSPNVAINFPSKFCSVFLKKKWEYCGRIFPFSLYFSHFGGVWLTHGSSLALSHLRKIEERIPPRVRRDSSSRIPQWKGTTLLRCSCDFWTQVTCSLHHRTHRR